MPSPADLRVVHAALVNQRRTATYAIRVGDIFYRHWKAVGGVDDAAAGTWIKWAAPTMRATQTQAAYSQVAYTREVARMLRLPPGGAVDVPSLVSEGLEERYMAPVITARSGLSLGQLFDDIMAEAGRQVREMARSDIADTSRDAAVSAMETTPGITHYRRVPSDQACDFCLLIAGQTYNTDELAPAHNNCTCSVAPITEESDATFGYQQSLSKDLYASQQRLDDAQANEARLTDDQEQQTT